MKILISESDAALANFLAQGLRAQEYEVQIRSVAEGGHAQENSDLILADLSMATEAAVPAVEELRRSQPAVLIVVLTTQRRSEELVRLLDAGADDYVIKPISFAELSARIRALGRRSRMGGEAVIKIGNLQLDRILRKVVRAGRDIELTIKEFAVLELLMRNAGRLVTRAEILRQVWKALPSPGSTNVVDVYIAYLRKKIDGSSPDKLIHTVRGAGYAISDSPKLEMSRMDIPNADTVFLGVGQ